MYILSNVLVYLNQYLFDNCEYSKLSIYNGFIIFYSRLVQYITSVLPCTILLIIKENINNTSNTSIIIYSLTFNITTTITTTATAAATTATTTALGTVHESDYIMRGHLKRLKLDNVNR